MIRFAVLPAAGQSMRMGRPKLTLPVGGTTVLQLALDALRSAGVGQCFVVTGPDGGDVAELAEQAGADVVRLAEATPDMRATLEQGLHAIASRLTLAPRDVWLLTPADHPTLDAALIRTLDELLAARPGCSIAVPTYGGKRGHPTLLRWSHAAGIRNHTPGEGVNTYLRRFARETLEVEAASPDVLADLDTPADYARLLGRLTQGGAD